LVVALVDLGRRLRARAARLRKRAGFEHLIADYSPPDQLPTGEISARIKQALVEL
jgi:hypothetical protein